MIQKRTDPNLLLYGFVLISIGIHFLVFARIAKLYDTRSVSCIELSMQTFSKPDPRQIPKPRMRTRPSRISRARTSRPCTRPVPKIRINMAQTITADPSCEKINIPKLPEHLNMAEFDIPALEIPGTGALKADIHEPRIEFTSARDYFEMLNLRIDRFKQYPEYARSRYIQGRVKVEFTVNRDGSLSKVRIVKSSRHRELDQAALEAVTRASPFPRPPADIFTPPVKFRVSILFELA